jgi:hypothetical protein
MLQATLLNLGFAAYAFFIEPLLAGRMETLLFSGEQDLLLAGILLGAVILEFIALMLSLPLLPRGKKYAKQLQIIWIARLAVIVFTLLFFSMAVESNTVLWLIQMLVLIKEIAVAVILGSHMEQAAKSKRNYGPLIQICLFLSLGTIHLALWTQNPNILLFMGLYIGTQTLPLIELRAQENKKAWFFWTLSLIPVCISLI